MFLLVNQRVEMVFHSLLLACLVDLHGHVLDHVLVLQDNIKETKNV